MMAVLTGTVQISMPTVKGKEVILGGYTQATYSARSPPCWMGSRAPSTLQR